MMHEAVLFSYSEDEDILSVWWLIIISWWAFCTYLPWWRKRNQGSSRMASSMDHWKGEKKRIVFIWHQASGVWISVGNQSRNFWCQEYEDYLSSAPPYFSFDGGSLPPMETPSSWYKSQAAYFWLHLCRTYGQVKTVGYSFRLDDVGDPLDLL